MNVQVKAPLYKQWDKRWSDRKLGLTQSTLEHAGCTLCAVAMALSSQGLPLDPGELGDRLQSHDGFTPSGLLVWSQIRTITQGRYSVQIDDHPDFAAIDGQLAKGNPLIAKVLYGGAIWHWVLITGKAENRLLIHDPLSTGPEYESMGEYSGGIYAIRYLEHNL
jgi:ABC-type bacteriocin/lantibiotic exporter with double-glycine peptidase domain